MSVFRRVLASASVVCAACAIATSAIADQTYNWRIQTLWQPGTANQDAFERFAENVKVMTDGKIRITALPSGAIVGVTETLDAVSRGILDGQHPATVYFTGRDPVFAILGDLIAGYENPYQAMEYFHQYGGLELLREAYAKFGVYPIGVAWWGVESIPSTKPIRGPDDLKGVRFRLPQGMASDLFELYGANSVNLPGTEVFSALDNGTIDAVDWGTLAMNGELGFHDKARYAIYPGIHSMPVGDVSISLKVWNSLSPQHQKILELAVKEFNLDMVQTLRKADIEWKEKLEAKGVELIEWSAEDRRRFRQDAVKIWRKYGESNDLARRAVESQIEYLKASGMID